MQVTGFNSDIGLELTLALIPGNYLFYQCLTTPDSIRSKNYKEWSFTASNGIRMASKNSPVLIDLKNIFFHGAFPEFDLKPTILHVKGIDFPRFRYDLETAIKELSISLTGSNA